MQRRVEPREHAHVERPREGREAEAEGGDCRRPETQDTGHEHERRAASGGRDDGHEGRARGPAREVTPRCHAEAEGEACRRGERGEQPDPMRARGHPAEDDGEHGERHERGERHGV